MKTLRQMVLDLWNVNTINPHHPELNQLVHTIQVTGMGWTACMVGEGVHMDRGDFLRACVLHDIGKARCMEARGNTHGHEFESSAMISEAADGVTISEDVIWLIENHIRIINLDAMRPKKQAALREHRLFKALTVLRFCDKNGRDPHFVVTPEVFDIFLTTLDTLGL